MFTSLLALGALVAPSLPPLRIQGRDFVDPSGKVVPLRGVNLGGWLVEEIWMTPWADNPPEGSGLPRIKDHESLYEVVAKRYGEASVARIRNRWRDRWITAEDFRRIRNLGFNHVRIPFLHGLLKEPGGIARLRWAVDEAAKNGLYTILDMHGTPGSQSGEHHTGKSDRNRLWFDVENISKMEDDWRTLSKEFGSNPNVAVFDLMNEPMGAPNPAMLHLVYDRVIRAVRALAPTKPILVDDGYKGFETTPHPNLANWIQVAFSLHFYHFEAKKTADHVAMLKLRMGRTLELQGYRDAPLYIGEFNLEPHGSPEAMKEYTELLTANKWSWAVWTYKTDAKSGPMGQWGLYSRETAGQTLDPYRDSEAQLMSKLDGVTTDKLRLVPGLDKVFR